MRLSRERMMVPSSSLKSPSNGLRTMYVYLIESATRLSTYLALSQAPSPFFPAISLICNAAVSCAIPPTSTEIKMIEELKKQWSTLMQKVVFMP